MEVGKKRAVEGAKTGSPKKQRVSKKGATGKSKKAPDSNKPKRPMSAYFFFLDWYRKELKQKKDNGEVTPTKIGDVAKSAGERWRSMSDELKKPFFLQNTDAKKAYNEQIKAIKPVRDENKPKKPRTAFFFFLEEFREEQKDSDSGEQGKKIPSLAGEKWRSMDDADKKKYTDMAADAKKEYDKQMKEYTTKNPKKPIEKAPKKAKVQVKEDSESEEEEDEEEDDNDDDGDDDDDEEEEESD